MSRSEIWERFRNRLRRERAEHCGRRVVTVAHATPLVSFTFDDFPKSALLNGGFMLKEMNWQGTYYTSFGLAGTTAPTGRIFDLDDLEVLFQQQHELGCHTYSHLHAWETPASVFEASVRKNQEFLERHFPRRSFPTLSYPISCPNPGVKRRAGAHFAGCRGGGQTFNGARMDLNHLRSFFLEQAAEGMPPVQRLIDEAVRCKGWLVFSTHDVAESPTPYGVRPGFFKRVIDAVSESGACVLPVGAALARMGFSHPVSSPGATSVLK